MSNKIDKKIYYKIEFSLTSPLIIGAEKSITTDKDIIRNGNNMPYIPGSAIAGICRSLPGIENKEKYFGNVSTLKKNNIETYERSESRIIFYDANLDDDSKSKYIISKRDSVALDEYKTAKDGSKFDMEVLEPGIRFITFFEQNLYSGDDEKLCDFIASAWKNKEIYIGAKTMRGYGEIGDVSIYKKKFDLKEKKEFEEWLDFDAFDTTSQWEEWNGVESDAIVETSGRKCLYISLALKGGISVRRYTTCVSKDDKPSPDFEQLTLYDNDNTPVIPGTTWAGAFRHHMEILNPDCKNNDIWGSACDNKMKSKIRFSETKLSGGTNKILTRNAINRFTGGTSDKALLTESSYYLGETILKISYDDILDDKFKSTLAAAIADLHYGLLAIGGSTAIGRGVFEITAINGKALNIQEPLFDVIKKLL